MKKIFIFFFILFPTLVFAITFKAGEYQYTASVFPTTSSLYERAKKTFSLENIILSEENTPQANLGYGFSTDRDTPTVKCIVDGGTEYGGSDKGWVETDVNYSLEQVKEQLHLSIKDDIDLGFFSTDVSADFVHNLETDKFSESFIYRNWIQLKNSIYKDLGQPEILNRIGKAYQNDPDMFRYICGDKYVNQMEWGGYLYVAVKFVFNSEEDEKKFNAEMGVDIGDIVKMSGKLSQAVSRISKDGAIKVQGLQIGGDPTKLGKIIGGEGGKAPIIYCTFDDLDKCHQMLDKVIVYATSPTDGNFPTQIKIGGPDIPISAATTNLDLLDYSFLGITIKAPSVLTKEMKDARHDLAIVLEQIKADEDRSKFLIGRFSYAADYVAKLQNTLTALQQNESAVTNAGMSCFTDLPNCVANAKNTLANLKPVNRNLLQQPSEQIVAATVNGSKHFDCDSRYWLLDTLPPSLKYDLKSGVISQDSPYYDLSFSSNGAKLSSVPPCEQKNTSVILLSSQYSLDRRGSFHDTQYITAFANGGLTIKQQVTCDNNYIVDFVAPGPIQRGGPTGAHNYWNDTYTLTYSAFHYDE